MDAFQQAQDQGKPKMIFATLAEKDKSTNEKTFM
jgi:hypothetical protein